MLKRILALALIIVIFSGQSFGQKKAFRADSLTAKYALSADYANGTFLVSHLTFYLFGTNRKTFFDAINSSNQLTNAGIAPNTILWNNLSTAVQDSINQNGISGVSWSGDLSGTGSNPYVAGLRGHPLSRITPTNSYVLKYDSSVDSVVWAADLTGSGGSGGTAYADSLRTIYGTFDADLWFDNSGQIDTTSINIAQWSDFVNDNSDTTLLMLDDTPSSYSADKILKVNSGGTGIEFGAIINELNDVNISSVANENILMYYSANDWTNVSTLLWDKDTTNDITIYNSTAWDKDASNDLTTSTSWGGDLYGTGSSPTVAAIRGKIVSKITPTNGYVLKYDSSVDSVLWAADLTGSGGSSTYLGLTDTPSSFTANYLVRVNSSGTALEHFSASAWDQNASNDLTSGTSWSGDLYGTGSAPSVAAIRGKNVSKLAPTNGYVLKYDSSVDSILWMADISGGSGGTSYADSLRTNDGTFDADLWLDASGQIDTTTINIAQWAGFVHENSDTILGDLSDVSLSALAGDQIIKYDGFNSKWVNADNTFLNLTDTPTGYTADYYVAVNGSGTALTLVAPTDTYLSLFDTPSSFSGNNLKIPRVNAGETAIEFGAQLTNLTDVYSTSESDGDILAYSGIGGEWENTSATSLGLITGVTATAPVTGGGTAGDVTIGVDTTGSKSLATRYKIDSLAVLTRTDQLQIPIVNPDSISSPKICVFKNYKGATVTIDSLKLSTDHRTANYVVDVQETLENDTTLSYLVDRITASVSGIGCYYKTETTISHATIENTHWVWLKLSRTVDVGDMQLTIFYHY